MKKILRHSKRPKRKLAYTTHNTYTHRNIQHYSAFPKNYFTKFNAISISFFPGLDKLILKFTQKNKMRIVKKLKEISNNRRPTILDIKTKS